MIDNLFIKMCDTPLIQDGWEPKVGDLTDKGFIIYCFKSYLKTNHLKTNHADYYEGTFVKSNLIFLPSETQLWTMLPQKQDSWLKWDGSIPDGFKKWHFGMYLGVRVFRADTAEQALIQGVMHELHGLVWTDGKWERGSYE